jgi:hypothetical protein
MTRRNRTARPHRSLRLLLELPLGLADPNWSIRERLLTLVFPSGAAT